MKDNEELLKQLESVANFLRGLRFDHRIPFEVKQALVSRVEQVEEVVDKQLKVNSNGKTSNSEA